MFCRSHTASVLLRAFNPSSLIFEPDALKEFSRYVNRVESRIGSELSVVESLAGKAPEHAARLAAVLSLVDDEDAQYNSATSLNSGIQLVEYYMRQAAKVKGTALGNSPQLVTAEKLRQWVKKRCSKTKSKEVALAEVYQLGPTEIRTQAKARAMLQVLEDHHWLKRHGVDRWEVHPKLLAEISIH